MVSTIISITANSSEAVKQIIPAINEDFARKADELKPQLYSWLEAPLSIIKFESDSKQFFNCKPIKTHSIAELRNISYGKGDSFILDFGSHRAGYFSIFLNTNGPSVDSPANLRFTFGQIPYDVTEGFYPSPSTISTSWLPDENVKRDYLPCKVEIERRHAFGYVKIEVLDTSPRYRIQFSNPTVKAVSAVSPKIFRTVKKLEVSQDLIELDRVSQVTLRDCMQEVFEDGPRRDRRLWMGDLRLQALTNYCTFKDFNLVKRCLYMFAAVAIEGKIPSCLFHLPQLAPGQEQDYIVDYAALFGSTVYDYAVASGDLATAKELWPTILGSMKIPLSHLNENRMFDSGSSPAWKFLDWSDGLHTSAGMHGVVLYSCKRINKLANLLLVPQPYLETVEKMTTAAAFFYDESLGVFVSGPERQVSWISQAWLALSGAMDNKILCQAILNAMADSNSIKPLTPYAYHHVAEGLARCGGEDKCLKLMREYWGGMVRAGAETFWECYDPEDSRKSPYNDCHTNSYCHAWSCTPSYLLREVLKDYLASSTNG